MTVNGFSAVSGVVNNYYNNTVQNGAPTETGAPAIQGLPIDVLEIGSKSLLTGIGISRQIATSSKAIQNADGSVGGVTHGNASLFKTGKNAAIISGLVSTAKNTYDYIEGKISGSRAGGNISADIIGGIGSGMLAAGTGSLAASAVASSMGAGVIGLLIGSAAFIGADILYRKTGLCEKVSDKVTAFIDNMLNRVHSPGGW